MQVCLDAGMLPSFYSIHFFLIGGQLLYNIVLTSAIHQHESDTGIHMSPSSWTPFPSHTPSHPSRLSQSTKLSSVSTKQISISFYIMFIFLYKSLNTFHSSFFAWLFKSYHWMSQMFNSIFILRLTKQCIHITFIKQICFFKFQNNKCY